MFDGVSNLKLRGELLKIHYPNISFMSVVQHTVFLIFDQIIADHKKIYDLFGYGIYRYPHYIFTSKLY